MWKKKLRSQEQKMRVLLNGLNVFVTFDLELKLAKCGLQACGGCNIGLVS